MLLPVPYPLLVLRSLWVEGFLQESEELDIGLDNIGSAPPPWAEAGGVAQLGGG